ncbi:MAG: hypothetical protein BroJett030_07610 [Alphaproteobacteria bacterium]|nr:MAG: hypothetical protein BroJett030_07610 [Alphaproteobacteria bacterium]
MDEQVPQHWSRIVAADLRQASRRAGELTVVGGRLAGRWWRDVAAWFRFVHRRKTDTRHAIFPGALRSAEILAVFCSLVLGLVLIADTLFLTLLNQRDAATVALFAHLTRLGDSAWILYLTGTLVLAISLYPARRLKRQRRVWMHGLLLVAYYLFTTVAFSGLITNLVKNLIGRARPQFVPEGMVWLSRPFADNYAFAGFPSGHATTAGAFCVALALLVPRLRVFIVLAGIWIAVSRPVLGVHFPSDIFAGFVFGGAFSYFYARSFARKRLLFAFRADGGLEPRPLARGRRP